MIGFCYNLKIKVADTKIWSDILSKTFTWNAFIRKSGKFWKQSNYQIPLSRKNTPTELKKLDVHSLSWAQFHKACKHTNLLSTEQFRLRETGYQPKIHKFYIVATGVCLSICLTKKFAKQYFLLNSFMKLGPDCNMQTFPGVSLSVYWTRENTNINNCVVDQSRALIINIQRSSVQSQGPTPMM